jgi:hypothetical protein
MCYTLQSDHGEFLIINGLLLKVSTSSSIKLLLLGNKSSLFFK